MKRFGQYSVESGQGLVDRSMGKNSRSNRLLLVMLTALCCLLPSAIWADEISARAAVVINGTSDKILYAKNPNLKLPPASTTKLVTAMVALDKISPETVITISENAASVPSVSPRLRAGDRFTIKDVLYLALMRSVNGAAVALAEAVSGSETAFVHLMNEKAAQVGAENTKFINASGLPGPDQYITAFDLAHIMQAALKYPSIKEIINTRTKRVYSLDGRRMFVKNTNQLLWLEDDVLGGKTGYTRAARHCFVCAAEKGQDLLVAAVLGESVRSDLWQDSRTLLSKGYEIITQKAEPMIYFSNVEEKPVVLAAYKTKKGHRHAKKAKLSKRSKHKKDGLRAAEKKSRKKKNNNDIARKGAKKTSGKDLS